MQRENADIVGVYVTGPTGKGAAALSDFFHVLQTLRTTLRHVERCLTGRDGKIEFDIVALELSSAAVKASPSRNDAIGKDICRSHRDTIQRLQSGRPVDSRLDHAAVSSFKGFSSPLRGDGTRVEVDGISITDEFSNNVEKLLEPDSTAIGSVSGMMDDFLLHGRFRFVLYTPLRGEEVACDFRPTMLADVLALAKKNVTVFGMLHYAAGRAYPVRVDVDRIEEQPSDEELPDLLDMQGAANHGLFAGSIDSIRAKRNEW